MCWSWNSPRCSPARKVVVRHGERVIQAEVRLVAPVVAADTRLGTVHVALPADPGLRPGMFARAEITGASREVVMVPASAIVFRDGAAQVFVLPEGQGRGHAPTAGARIEGQAEVIEGLRLGERGHRWRWLPGGW